jgi:hypothetical protein
MTSWEYSPHSPQYLQDYHRLCIDKRLARLEMTLNMRKVVEIAPEADGWLQFAVVALRRPSAYVLERLLKYEAQREQAEKDRGCLWGAVSRELGKKASALKKRAKPVSRQKLKYIDYGYLKTIFEIDRAYLSATSQPKLKELSAKQAVRKGSEALRMAKGLKSLLEELEITWSLWELLEKDSSLRPLLPTSNNTLIQPKLQLLPRLPQLLSLLGRALDEEIRTAPKPHRPKSKLAKVKLFVSRLGSYFDEEYGKSLPTPIASTVRLLFGVEISQSAVSKMLKKHR